MIQPASAGKIVPPAEAGSDTPNRELIGTTKSLP